MLRSSFDRRLLRCLPTREFSVKELPWCSPVGSPNRRGKKLTDGATSHLSQFAPIDRFGIVAAVSLNGVIGVDGKLPWNLPSDRAAFVDLTADKLLIIGRRTFEEEKDQSHISHAKKTVVVSKSLSKKSLSSNGNIVLARSFPQALHMAREIVESHPDMEDDSEAIHCWVAGGEEIYHKALLHPSAQCLHLTEVHTIVAEKDEGNEVIDGLARFPSKDYFGDRFQMQSKERCGFEGELEYSRHVLRRRGGPQLKVPNLAKR